MGNPLQFINIYFFFKQHYLKKLFRNRLSSIASSRRQSKKSRRCVYHSLESQRLVRPMASGWQDIWKHMTEPCKDEIVLIEASSLLSTLDNYLRKHR